MKIVVLDGYLANPGDLSWEPLAALGDLQVWDRTAPWEIVERSAEADILLTNKVAIGRDMLDMLTRLKAIVVMATGYANVDTTYARLLGIRVFNVPGYSTPSVVQHTLGFLLEASNNFSGIAASVRAGAWQQSADFSYNSLPLVDLAGKTLGILGYGVIGRQVARLAALLGMKIVVGTSHPESAAAESHLLKDFEFVTYEDLAGRCDYLSLHAALTELTAGIIGSDFLARCAGRPPVLINTARGGLVDTAALLAALDSGLVSRYLTDVLDQEPPSSKGNLRLLEHPAVFATPHVAWSSFEARQRLLEGIVARVREYMAGDFRAAVNFG